MKLFKGPVERRVMTVMTKRIKDAEMEHKTISAREKRQYKTEVTRLKDEKKRNIENAVNALVRAILG